ncbi:MAG: hypothetical protein WCA46_22170, partial [Actinocatenispora sp.]
GVPAPRAAAAAAFAHGLAGRRAAVGGPVTSELVRAALRPVVGALTGSRDATQKWPVSHGHDFAD